MCDGSILKKFEGHINYVRSLALSNNVLVSGSHDHSVLVWDVSSASILRKLNFHNDRVTGVAISSDGKTIASCSSDSKICIWGTVNDQPVHTLT